MTSNDAYYDKLSNIYESKYKRQLPFINTVNQKIYEFLNNKFDPTKNILDVGVGDGERAKNLISKLGISKSNYYGIEPSKNMYTNAKKYLLDDNLYNLNIESFDQSLKFDCIWFLWNVVGHVDDLDLFIFKVSKLLKKDGYIIFDYNNIFNISEYGLFNFIKNSILSLFTSIFKYELNYLNEKTFVNFYTKSFITKILKKNNFVIEDVHYINYQNGAIEKYMYKGQTMIICKYVPN